MPYSAVGPADLPSSPTRRSSDLRARAGAMRPPDATTGPDGAFRVEALRLHPEPYTVHATAGPLRAGVVQGIDPFSIPLDGVRIVLRSEEHTSELQSLRHLVCRILPSAPQISPRPLHDALPISGRAREPCARPTRRRAPTAPSGSRRSASIRSPTRSTRPPAPCGPAWSRGSTPSRSPLMEFGSCSDRKSTRLNSSHLGISYAVFCRRPRRSPLVPYTTLFRSPGARGSHAPARRDDGPRRRLPGRGAPPPSGALHGPRDRRPPAGRRGPGDRPLLDPP